MPSGRQTTSLAASQQIDKIFPKKKWKKKKKTAKSNKGREKVSSQQQKQITGGLQ